MLFELKLLGVRGLFKHWNADLTLGVVLFALIGAIAVWPHNYVLFAVLAVAAAVFSFLWVRRPAKASQQSQRERRSD
jgi:membrane protein implicated in regulation of membrane protease activity